MLCQARKNDGSLCNNLAIRGSKTCHIEKHRKQFVHIQNGGWGGPPIEDLFKDKEYFTQKGGWGESKVSWFGGIFN